MSKLDEQYIQGYMQISLVRVGHVVVLKNRPCKISNITTAAPGKHGAAKAIMTGFDVVRGAKIQESRCTCDNIAVPKLVKEDYTLCDFDTQTNLISVLDKNLVSHTYDVTDENVKKALCETISKNKDADADVEIKVTIMHCAGVTKVLGHKIMN